MLDSMVNVEFEHTRMVGIDVRMDTIESNEMTMIRQQSNGTVQQSSIQTLQTQMELW